MSNNHSLRRIHNDIRSIMDSENPMVVRRRMHRNFLRAKKICIDLLSNDDLGAVKDIARACNVSTAGTDLEVLIRVASITSDSKATDQLARIVNDGLFLGEKRFISHASRELEGKLGLTKPMDSNIVWTAA